MRYCAQYLLIALVSIFGIPAAYAGVTVIQPLRFGEFIVRNNDMVHTITVNVVGTYSYDPGFIEINPTAQHGIYDIDGLPPSTAIMSVNVIQTIPLSGSGENFQMDTFQEAHPAATDASGVARIRIGGNANTSGNGNPYLDQTYNGQLQITINF